MRLDTAVIPCGGLGTRLAPVTRWIPKELLPVALKPLLHWTLDEIADAGLLHAIIVLNPARPAVESVARAWSGPLELEFVAQDRPRGLGDALLRARDLLAGAPFIAVLPDNLFLGENPTRQVVASWHATRLASVLLTEIGSEESRSKGATGKAKIATRSDGTILVTDIADKGTGRFQTGGESSAVTPIGRIALAGDVFNEFEDVARSLPLNAELDDIPVLQRLARREALAGVLSKAKFFDVGVPEGYRDAVCSFPPNTK
ncbi:MAG: sugar phosphate nucleotidyltransferase [Gemmatimonadota bacterium]